MMRRNVSKKHHVSTSDQEISPKPYGFCCDPKDDSKVKPLQKVLMPPFLSNGTTNDGPDIKFRIHEEEISSGTRGAQRGGQRLGQRGRRLSGLRYRNLSRLRNPNVQRGGNRNERQRGGANVYRGNISRSNTLERNSSVGPNLADRMICQRCRGPLKWYLEDEIAVAREIMINRRIRKYNADMERNIKIAKKKEKRKRRTYRKKPVNEVKEDTHETEE